MNVEAFYEYDWIDIDIDTETIKVLPGLVCCVLKGIYLYTHFNDLSIPYRRIVRACISSHLGFTNQLLSFQMRLKKFATLYSLRIGRQN